MSPKNALVTGAAAGIGLAVARRLIEEGGSVALLDRDGEALAKATSDLGAGARALPLTVDVADPAAVDAAVDCAERTLGPLDNIVCAAGVLLPAPLSEITEEAWQQHLSTNASGVFHILRAVAARMVARRSGAIVVVGSNAAAVPRQEMAAYAASKAAATALARCVGLEVAPHGVRVNVVEPGSTDTAMQRALWLDPADGLRRAVDGNPESYRVGIPLGRIAAPEDVADAVAYLLSDGARHITLQRLGVDGGASL